MSESKKTPKFHNPHSFDVWVRTETNGEIRLLPRAAYVEGTSDPKDFFVEGEHYRKQVRPHGALAEEPTATATVFPSAEETGADTGVSEVSNSPAAGLAPTQAEIRGRIADRIRERFQSPTRDNLADMEKAVDFVIAAAERQTADSPEPELPESWRPYETELRQVAGLPPKIALPLETTEETTINEDEYTIDDTDTLPSGDADPSEFIDDDEDDSEHEDEEDDDNEDEAAESEDDKESHTDSLSNAIRPPSSQSKGKDKRKGKRKKNGK